MNIKSLISKNNLTRLIHPLIYALDFIILVFLLLYLNNNVYKTITIQGDELKDQINEAPKDINMKEFNAIIEKINIKKAKSKLNIKEIF